MEGGGSEVEEQVMAEASQEMNERTPSRNEDEGSQDRHPSSEDASITKKDLVKIIANQDEAIGMLRREVEMLKEGAPSPMARKRERASEAEGESSSLRRLASMRRLADYGDSEGERNVWMQGRPPRQFVVRQPLARSILVEPANTNIPPLPTYDGTADPDDHLNNYFTKMQLYNSTDATLCKVFPSTFAGVVLDWYHQIEEGRIEGFEQFAAMFLAKFASRKRRTLTVGALFKIKQKEGETLREFYERWIPVAMAVKDVHPSVLGVILEECTTSEELCRALSKKDVVSTEDLDRRVQKVIVLEETLAARRADRRRSRGEEGEGVRRQAPNPRSTYVGAPFGSARKNDQGRPTPRANPFTELNDSPKNVLQYVKDKGYHVRWPGPMRGQPNPQNLDRYYDFHRERGHNTVDWYQLKTELQGLVDRGRFNEFVKKPEEKVHRAYTARAAPKEDLPPPPFELDQEKAPEKVRLTVEAITGVMDLRVKLEAGRRLRAASVGQQGVYISFNQAPEEAYGIPSLEALEIQGVVAGCTVKRMLVDTGSSMDVLLSPDLIRPSDSVLVGFSGAPAKVIGRMPLPVTLGDEEQRVTHAIDFGIVDCPSPYNAILGRPLLALFNGVASTCHQTLKFIAPQGVGIARGRGAPVYAQLKGARPRKSQRVNMIATEEAPRAEAADEELMVPLDEGRLERQVRMSVQAPPEMIEGLIALLREFAELFAWSAKEMPGVTPETAVHRLAVEAGRKPVQQKRRNLSQEKEAMLRVEVDKLLDAGFVEEAAYVTWLSNVVFVPKPAGDWRMCVDFTSLNKACPTDAYPMP
ncbi:unnamed protein product [Linum trigynum]|uniref:Retrotransposon gag domain-containing protein n=1 Tax=Linum trigynum TaxID=586398 RepID=A0AAV2E171_9ROSI